MFPSCSARLALMRRSFYVKVRHVAITSQNWIVMAVPPLGFFVFVMLLHASFYEYFLFLCVVEPISWHLGLWDLHLTGHEAQREKLETGQNVISETCIYSPPSTYCWQILWWLIFWRICFLRRRRRGARDAGKSIVNTDFLLVMFMSWMKTRSSNSPAAMR